jgi:hypothetical protein
MRPHRFLIVIILLGATLGFALGALGTLARAQETPPEAPPVAPGPEERVLFAPNMGVLRRSMPGAPDGSVPGDLEGGLADQAGLRVQNLGDHPTRVLAFYFDEWKPQEEPSDAWTPEPTPTSSPLASDQPAQETDCDTCGDMFNAICSPPIAPGETWTFPLRRTDAFTPTGYPTRTVLAAATAYSLNHRPAKDYGSEWEEWVGRSGLDPDATVADVICHEMERAIQHPEAISPEDPQRVQCTFYRGFHGSYLGRESAFSPADFHAVPGEPIAGVAAVPMPSVDGSILPVGGTFDPWSYDRLALDRYAAVPLSETGFRPDATDSMTYTTYVPGVYTTTPEGQQGVVFMQNTGTECATVHFDAIRTGSGPVTQGSTVELPIGSWWAIQASVNWPQLRGSITVRVQSNQPIAVAATTLGYLTSGTFTGLHAREAPVAWAVPLAYQAPRPAPLDALLPLSQPLGVGAGGRGPAARNIPAAADSLQAANGWETNVAIVNPATERNMVRMETQAPGVPPRDASYPIEPLNQIVLQLGLGLGLTGGGEGWGRLSSGERPMAITLESFRMASDVPAATEAWTTTAWPYDPTWAEPGPRAIALPDLGGPAVGGIDPARLITRTATMTDALVGRILVQSLYTGTARVAIDSFASDGGYVGSTLRSIDRYQTISVPLAELPGTRWGANSATVRVLEGNVAVMFETNRAAPVEVDEAPPDHTSAYLGQPMRDAVVPRGGAVFLPALRNGEIDDR